MKKTCNSCGEVKTPSTVPYQVLADFKEMHKSTVKKLWIALIVAWVSVLAVVGIFTYERLQYDYVGETYTEEIVYTQDGHGTNIIGNENEVNNGADFENKENNSNP